MDSLHSGNAQDGIFKAKLLVICGGAAAIIKLLGSHAILERVRLGWMAIPEALDGWIYNYVTPRLGGTELRQLTISLEGDPVGFAMGGLMGIRTGTSLLIGALLNYFALAPWMIGRGDIVPVIKDGVEEVCNTAGADSPSVPVPPEDATACVPVVPSIVTPTPIPTLAPTPGPTDTPEPPPPTPTPTATPVVVTVTPEPTLPVLYLPETGTQESQAGLEIWEIFLLLVIGLAVLGFGSKLIRGNSR